MHLLNTNVEPSIDTHLFKQLCQHIDMGVVLYEYQEDINDFIFVGINDASLELEKKLLNELLGKRLTHCFPGVESFGLFDMMYRVLRTDIPEVLSPRVYEDSTTKVWRECKVTKLQDNYILVIYKDMKQWAEMTEDLETQKKIATAATKLASLGQLSFSIGHEIKNYLTIISGFSEVLFSDMQQSQNTIDQDSIENIKAIHQAALSIEKVLKDFTKISKSPSEYVKVRLSNLFNEALSLIEPDLKKYHVHLTHNIHKEECQCYIYCNPSILIYVFINLLRNAKEHARAHDNGWINIEISCQDIATEIRIENSGSKIDPSRQEDLFRPFHSQNIDGWGFGLFLSKTILESHNGSIRIDNCNHPCFVVTLPTYK